jgi:hypothetical protein
LRGRLLDQHGKPVALAGPSFFWSNTGWDQEKFYNAQAVKTFASDWNASVLRAAMGVDARGGYLEDKANQAQWAVSDRKEGASLFKPGASGSGPWLEADLTDSGKLLRAILKDWKTTCP